MIYSLVNKVLSSLSNYSKTCKLKKDNKLNYFEMKKGCSEEKKNNLHNLITEIHKVCISPATIQDWTTLTCQHNAH